MAYCSKGRVCITLKKTSQLKSDVEIEAKENFDFAEALESVYPLLEIVFNYLDNKDLRAVSQVKHSWHVTAKRILKKRNGVSWLTVFRKKRKSYVEHSRNYLYDNMDSGIILFNYQALSLSDFFCCHEDISSRKIKFSDFLAEHIIPQGTRYCVIGCPGLGSLFSKQVVNNRASVPLFDGCFIPPIPNVKVSMFHCDPLLIGRVNVQPNQRLKCVLLFCKTDLEDTIYNLLENILPHKQDFSSVAIGGGIIRRTTLFPNNDCYLIRKSSNNLCITFTEDIYAESVFNASSIVIIGNNISSENFEEQLKKFKTKILIRSNSMAFRICCSAKMKKNYEAKTFNQIFPDTPLLGLEAEGEIGWDCFNLPNENQDDECQKSKKVKKEAYPKVQHQWSTVIVFITWGHLLSQHTSSTI